jgi:hypothetical protein
VIRQFVAMPLGSGYSAEEQITGRAEHGGLQIVVYPLKRAAYERMLRARERAHVDYCLMDLTPCAAAPRVMEMGLAPGGRMRQEIYDDPHRVEDWDLGHSSRCFVHIANSLIWRSITGQEPPTVPPTAEEYTRAGLPWFEWYGEGPARGGSEQLRKLRSVKQMGEAKNQVPLPENTSVEPTHVVGLGKPPKKGQVREGVF